MKKEYRDGYTYAILEESISSTNAPLLDELLKDEPNNTKGVIVDARKLDYISSAGLRALLSSKKRCKGLEFRVINVNVEVKSIFDMTGFSDIMEVQPLKRQVSVEGCKQIGRGACGECFRINEEEIIKLYFSHVPTVEIEREKELAKKAFVMGVPTAISYDIVESEGRTGLVYELINSKTLSELIANDPDNIDKYIDMYVNVCKDIHSIEDADHTIPDFKDINRSDIYKIENITEEEKMYINKLIDLCPVENTCVHGDLNINNIMVQNGECCLIDMGEFAFGNHFFDISRIMFSMYFTKDPSVEFNKFFKLPQATVDYVYDQFMTKYFGTKDYEELIANDPQYEWLYPLAWLRCIMSMHRNNKWPQSFYDMSDKMLKEKLIPFVKSKLEK